MRDPARYVGRFAPSPTGPLHFGSLVAATASYLDARAHDGQWLVRIEDIDPPRAQRGADRSILASLERFGFQWDGPAYYQSASTDAHQAALDTLQGLGILYRCDCSRRSLAAARQGPLGAVYPGTCRARQLRGDAATRVRTSDTPIAFDDRLQGHQVHRLESESGDFVVLRRDGLIAYQLAVVVDDAAQGITDVVRGIDLLPSTPRQLHLFRLLELEPPRYAHVPVVVGTDGAKLSKATGAPPVSDDNVRATLVNALQALQQAPEPELRDASLEQIWVWAIANWRPAALAGETDIAMQHYC